MHYVHDLQMYTSHIRLKLIERSISEDDYTQIKRLDIE